MKRPIGPGDVVMVVRSRAGNAGRTGTVVRWIEKDACYEALPGHVVAGCGPGWLVEAAHTFVMIGVNLLTDRTVRLEVARGDFAPDNLIRLAGPEGEPGDAEQTRRDAEVEA